VLFDPASGETRAMRSKEEAHDYRYFPDPDLLPLEISAAWIEDVKAALPELPDAMQARFVRDYGLSPYDAGMLTASRETADYFVGSVKSLLLRGIDVLTSPEYPSAEAYAAKLCANWMMGELAARLNREEKDIADSPLSPAQLAGLAARVADGTLSGKMAKEVFDALWNGEAASADAIIEAKGLKQISDTGALEKIIDEVLAANPKSVEEFRAGKEKAFNALVGQAMKATKGKANPQQVNELLKKKLAG
jgi:aspartyl-tRNA(Asn)/glutamyl-tRNA(Gln) amidotransferase subunit B